MSTALFIGRFQPFHIGHASAIAAMPESHIIIGIGSSQYSGTPENPFTFEERKGMIEKSLPQDAKKYTIIAIPDIHDADRWVSHVESIVGAGHTVYTGNDITKQLFERKKYTVLPVQKNMPISASALRNMLQEHNTDWHAYVSPENIPMLTAYYAT
ncbi:MAG: nicotinamide-nucleotide adenylyltransferase [Candidatus Magasanikbacteria bacterium CG10_big_fil_rev_8_21_14_0_10_43_6]|uniref:Nicotinamide-nucleotide adenylyltransferase n=1 Tax=Candidatus Magasanikbacteria bacterium CG10_big_fil_rev_8_21_14_0_10_43_6 TaxID=1974650 RepID=A0A2M6W1R1_9BACT|nr:MAG: nicotinamide-nucleotide adenylyltransferase [Candidatus Magasanikbacteria bacterium CG10_big_fil_rev_8_21_14_0_10_43_6]